MYAPPSFDRRRFRTTVSAPLRRVSSRKAMASSLGIWLLLSVYTRIALAQTLAYWYSPPNAGATSNYDENPTLTIGEVFELRWTTVIDSYQIVLWQQNLDIETSMYGSAVYSESRILPYISVKWESDTLRVAQSSKTAPPRQAATTGRSLHRPSTSRRVTYSTSLLRSTTTPAGRATIST